MIYDKNISMAYLAMLGRIPEISGIEYWSQRSQMVYGTNNPTVQQICDLIISDLNSQNQLIEPPSDDNSYFTEAVYCNILGKSSEEDLGGIQYWINKLNTNAYGSRGGMIQQLLSDAQSATGFAGQTFQNRMSALLFGVANQRLHNTDLGYQNSRSIIRATYDDLSIATNAMQRILAGTPIMPNVWYTTSYPGTMWADSKDSPMSDGVRRYKKLLIADPNANLFSVQVYLPHNFINQSGFQAIIAFHGGGWRNGFPEQIDRYCDALAARGFVVIAPLYYLTALTYNIGQITNCVRNLLTLFQSPETTMMFKLNGNIPYNLGISAGGHLAIYDALTNQGKPGVCPKVAALSPPCDLVNPTSLLLPYVEFLNGNPVSQYSPNSIAGLSTSTKYSVFQGALDPLISPTETARFSLLVSNALGSYPCTYTVLPNSSHEYYDRLDPYPDPTVLNQVVDSLETFYNT